MSVTLYLFLFSCIHFKEHPLDPTTPRGYFLSSFLRNFTNSSIYQEAKGILDDSFGNGSGYVTLNINNDNDQGQSLAIQPDGKILLGGYCSNGSNGDFCIARFNSDGNLNTSFGSPNGYIIQPIGSSYDYGVSLAIQPDGKILLGGYCSNGLGSGFCIARFNSDGTLD
ncbi:MAG: delta-60 repeat domain-containing protein, partial [Leptonema sp. (in: bacteria)]